MRKWQLIGVLFERLGNIEERCVGEGTHLDYLEQITDFWAQGALGTSRWKCPELTEQSLCAGSISQALCMTANLCRNVDEKDDRNKNATSGLIQITGQGTKAKNLKYRNT